VICVQFIELRKIFLDMTDATYSHGHPVPVARAQQDSNISLTNFQEKVFVFSA
jgi:hypothetical protein